MENNARDELAEQLRAVYVRKLTGRQPSSWALMKEEEKDNWRAVVDEARNYFAWW